MEEGEVVVWLKEVGDYVAVGDVVCDIKTDKATLGFESIEEGYLAKILVGNESEPVNVGRTIGVMVEEEEDIKNVDLNDIGDESSGSVEAANTPVETPVVSTHESSIGVKATKISPAAAFYLRTYGIASGEVLASGPKGILQKGDVLKHIAQHKLQK
jgi:pyruvate dehydrogenase E2 component (dihydrolipoamide acetyltransferase)